MKPASLIYFGSPQFSAEILKYLLINSAKLNINVIGAVTQPDQPVGRKQIVTPSEVALIASEYHLPTFKPDKLDDSNLSHLKLLHPDIFLIASYGKFIPDSWLALPQIATLNIHFSLLPKYRGALCISEPIRNQEETTGVTLMEMDKDMDHGPIIGQVKQSIDINDNVATLTTKLTQSAKTLIDTYLPPYIRHEIHPQEQDHNSATFTPVRKNNTYANSHIDWSDLKSAMTGSESRSLHAFIRSVNPEPGAHTTLNGQDIKILETKLNGDKLEILTVQTPGKNPVSWKQYLAGHPIKE